MKRFVTEDVHFKLTVIDGKNGIFDRLDCRNGHEIGDSYTCSYECPKDFCQKCMLKAFPIMEAARAGGDLRLLGGMEKDRMEFDCPDGTVTFLLEVLRDAPNRG